MIHSSSSGTNRTRSAKDSWEGIHHEEGGTISFAGCQLSEVRHICAFFNSDDEEYRVLLPFIKDGFERGDKAVHVVNPDQHRDHLQRLTAVGIDPAAAQQSGQLELRTNTETYLRDGRFDQDRMLEVFEQAASGNAHGRISAQPHCLPHGLGGRRWIAHR